MNIFDRTAIFCREKKDADLKPRYTRIPWDIISFADGTIKSKGTFLSPMPVGNMFNTVVTTDTITNIVDMLYDDKQDIIDAITDIMYFDSEAAFHAAFGGTVGYYESDPSAEFGYPCNSGI